MKLRQIQKKHWKWAKRNFGKPDPSSPLLGAVEELGELAHSHIKSEQGIRGSSVVHEANGQDAIGDIILFLMQYCSLRGWDLQDILRDTAEDVWLRDWKAYPDTGYPPAEEPAEELYADQREPCRLIVRHPISGRRPRLLTDSILRNALARVMERRHDRNSVLHIGDMEEDETDA